MPSHPSALQLKAAVSVLRQGGVVACPTEAVWGLSCDPNSEYAVEDLLALKGRPMSKGLILVAANQRQVDFLLSGLTEQQHQTVCASWPGPTTWLLPHRDLVPEWVYGDHATVAVRVSAHPVVSALCTAWGGPLVSTSANPAGARPAREAYQVRRYFRSELDFVLAGKVGAAARPTTIRDVSTGRIVRD